MVYKSYYFHNLYHLGDNVFNMIFFKILETTFIQNKIIIHYYCQPEYIDQIKDFNSNSHVVIDGIHHKPPNSIELWIDKKMLGLSWTKVYNHNRKKGRTRSDYNKFFSDFFNNVLKMMNVPRHINLFYYKDRNLIDRYLFLSKQFNKKYSNIDLLILNSEPRSGQYQYNKSDWDNYIKDVNSHFKVICTTKVEGINCTSDDNLSIKDIAAISIKAKVIIAVNSGVVPGLLNKYTLNNVRHVYIFDNRCKFSYKKFENRNQISEITINELKKYI